MFLTLDGLSKSFGDHPVVDGVSLEVARGEIFALLGPSGCGKTTLLRMLAGFEPPSAGRVLLDGQDITSRPPHERPLNMMFQSYALFPHLNVWDNIAFGLRRDGLSRDQVAQRVDAMLTLVQLGGYGRRKPHQLSGGQQQRVALARSLAKRPQLLLLDEPLGALDKKLREQTQIELTHIVHDVGVTCVMVTHDQDEAMSMADRIGVMHQGRLLQVDTPATVYDRPVCRVVADFIGDVNLIEGRWHREPSGELLVRSADGRLQLDNGTVGPPGGAAWLALRPEKIRLCAEPPHAAATPNLVSGVVHDVAYFGHHTVYHLLLASGYTLKVSDTHAQPSAPRPTVGTTVWAQWERGAPVLLSA